MKNNFNIQRCWQFIQQDIVFSRSYYLHLLLGLFIGFFAFMVLFSLGGWLCLTPIHDGALITMSKVSSIIYLVYIMTTGALTFRGLEIPQWRISFLMLPVENIEKFIGRIIITIALCIIAIPLLFVVSDGLRLLFEWIICGSIGSTTLQYIPRMIKHIFNLTVDINMIPSHLNGLIVYAFTFFLLCSSAFRRKAFIKGVGIYNLVMFLFFLLLFSSLYTFADNVNITDEDFNVQTLQAIPIALNIELWMVSMLNIWWSYKNFCKSTVA